MKNIYKIAVMLVASVMLLSSCHKRGECIDLPEKGALQITASDIQWLRTAGNSWVENDAIGVYAFTSGEALSAASIYDGKANIKFTTDGTGVFTTTPAIMLPAVNSVDLIAYYPYSESITDFTYAFNTSDQSDLAKIDLLYANDAKGFNATKTVASMNFYHKLTLIQIELNTNGEELVDPELSIEGAIVDGSMSLVDGKVKTGVTKNNPSIIMPEKNAEGIMIGQMILPPQTYEANNLTLKIGADKVLSAIIPNFITKSGYRYILKVNYVKEGTQGSAELRVDSSTIEDWNTDPAVDIPEMDINDKVTVEVVEVKVTPETHTMNVGESLTLAFNILPDNATDKSIVWSSSAPEIASVENAVVKALKAGITIITAKSTNGKEGKCTVTVKEINPDKSIPDVPGENL